MIFGQKPQVIMFDLSTGQNKTVCLGHYHMKSKWLLAKGRRNCSGSHHKTALCEVHEETGYQSQLHASLTDNRDMCRMNLTHTQIALRPLRPSYGS